MTLFSSSLRINKTTRRQRLRLPENNANDIKVANKLVSQSLSNSNIYTPNRNRLESNGFSRANDSRSLQRKSLNKSALHSNYKLSNDSPKQTELRIQEALDDHIREGKEQNLAILRLAQSNRKQRVIYDEHYNKFIIPSLAMVNAKKQNEHARYREAKNRMDQLEIEHYNKANILK